MKNRRFILLMLNLLTGMVLLQGCFMFRKKNRCNTCPNFHSEVVHKPAQG